LKVFKEHIISYASLSSPSSKKTRKKEKSV